jgi:hypothetical protein
MGLKPLTPEQVNVGLRRLADDVLSAGPEEGEARALLNRLLPVVQQVLDCAAEPKPYRTGRSPGLLIWPIIERLRAVMAAEPGRSGCRSPASADPEPGQCGDRSDCDKTHASVAELAALLREAREYVHHPWPHEGKQAAARDFRARIDAALSRLAGQAEEER